MDTQPPVVASISVAERIRGVTSALRQVFGIPDYDRYLDHVASKHPGAPVLSRREFFAQSIDRRYRKSAGRCC